MLPGPDVVLACPTCGALVRQRSLASGNTFGATLWSDGFFDAPMLPQEPALTRCPEGGHWFWIDDAETVGTSSEWGGSPDEPLQWTSAPYTEPLAAADYADALLAGLGSTPDREAFLRLRLWWTAGDAHRGATAAPDPDRDNLERLQALQNDAPLNVPVLEQQWNDEPDDDEPDDVTHTERGEPVLRAAVAHALGQPARAQQELASAQLPPEWNRAFAAVIAAGDRRLVALS